MTWYAVDVQRHMLVRVMPTAQGSSSGDVVHYWPDHEGTSDGEADQAECSTGTLGLLWELAAALTSLSAALWSNYARPDEPVPDEALPGGSVPDELLPDDSVPDESLSDESQRDDRRDAVLGEVHGALQAPLGVPANAAGVQPGPALQRYLRRGPVGVQEAAHRVGRVLQRLNAPMVTEAVVAEVEEELRGVEGAESGNLAGRGAQAVRVTRTDASALQVVAAFDALGEDPLDGRVLLESIDPHSAAVASAYWLFCAVQVASAMTGSAAEHILAEADEIEELPIEAPARVLELMVAGEDPYEAVTQLIREALQAQVEDSTPLDPRGPGPALLEDLLTAIYGAFLVWDERDPNDGAPSQDASDEQWQDFQVNRREAFSALVKAEATRRRGQLGLAPV